MDHMLIKPVACTQGLGQRVGEQGGGSMRYIQDYGTAHREISINWSNNDTGARESIIVNSVKACMDVADGYFLFGHDSPEES